MGGALATMCVRYLAELPQYQDKTKLGLVTFGSPCVGNAEFADSVNRKVGEVWRFVCEDDAVPEILTLDNNLLSCTLTCLCCGCMLCCCRDQLQKVNVQQQPYVHAGKEILIGNDGFMMAEPNFVDHTYLGIARNACRVDKIIENHFHYDRCLRMWIHHVHGPEENLLLDKIIIGWPEDNFRPGQEIGKSSMAEAHRDAKFTENAARTQSAVVDVVT
jgi:hypothetical protein